MENDNKNNNNAITIKPDRIFKFYIAGCNWVDFNYVKNSILMF